jgi:hypothetical protein
VCEIDVSLISLNTSKLPSESPLLKGKLPNPLLTASELVLPQAEASMRIYHDLGTVTACLADSNLDIYMRKRKKHINFSVVSEPLDLVKTSSPKER